MPIPLKYSFRSLGTRRLTTGLTMFGVALVVFVFAAVLMMAQGLQHALITTGSDDNVIVLRKAANAEITSIIDRDQASIITSLAQVKKDSTGTALATKEAVVVINLPYYDKVGFANISVRGVSPQAFMLRPQVKLVSGRMFRFGSREVIVGSSITKRFRGARVGESIKFGGDNWLIVGSFDTDGTGFDSEVWGDCDQLGEAFGRPVFSSLTVRLERRDMLADFAAEIEHDNRLNTLEAKRETQFYEEQSEAMSMFIRVLGIAITIIFSAGAMIGAMITMYAAVANRTTEIGTLRALGFGRMSILAAFLIESVFLSLLGGIVGLGFASLLQFFSVSMMNFGSFTELAFNFTITPAISVSSIMFAVCMGLIGGFLPAVRASRMSILGALRSS
jgi:ABC-type antimicrobial peptide transport system permease subunit